MKQIEKNERMEKEGTIRAKDSPSEIETRVRLGTEEPQAHFAERQKALQKFRQYFKRHYPPTEQGREQLLQMGDTDALVTSLARSGTFTPREVELLQQHFTHTNAKRDFSLKKFQAFIELHRGDLAIQLTEPQTTARLFQAAKESKFFKKNELRHLANALQIPPKLSEEERLKQVLDDYRVSPEIDLNKMKLPSLP